MREVQITKDSETTNFDLTKFVVDKPINRKWAQIKIDKSLVRELRTYGVSIPDTIELMLREVLKSLKATKKPFVVYYECSECGEIFQTEEKDFTKIRQLTCNVCHCILIKDSKFINLRKVEND